MPLPVDGKETEIALGPIDDAQQETSGIEPPNLRTSERELGFEPEVVRDVRLPIVDRLGA